MFLLLFPPLRSYKHKKSAKKALAAFDFWELATFSALFAGY
jgi:hypothetical protein